MNNNMLKTPPIRNYLILIRNIILIVFAGLLLYSCSECEPISDPGNILVVSFYSKDVYESSEELVLLNLNLGEEAFSTLIKEETIIPYETIGTYQYGLPLPIDAENFAFFVNYPEEFSASYTYDSETITLESEINRNQDTIAISFTKSFETVSPDCGFVTHYENIILNSTSFEKAEINFDYTIDNDSTNVRVFL
ncbi:hypothetical protein [Chondrinema litorale]|uniref:hypothetical protein n=1 Tax=Chondrinema litorale TaxID=2994555 RepID=UPI002542E913|nr:hypothetical protein [Chondrinema litorale]UZR95870.1 hypothetical protein OQ292_08595 [Chondrinema litorale]